RGRRVGAGLEAVARRGQRPGVLRAHEASPCQALLAEVSTGYLPLSVPVKSPAGSIRPILGRRRPRVYETSRGAAPRPARYNTPGGRKGAEGGGDDGGGVGSLPGPGADAGRPGGGGRRPGVLPVLGSLPPPHLAEADVAGRAVGSSTGGL